MPHPGDDISLAEPTTDRVAVAVSCLSSVDVLANIFAFLGVKDIMCNRRVNKKWKEAVKKTVVPPADFRVNSVTRFNAMRVMTREMPNLQQLSICDLGCGHKWSDGEDRNEAEAARFDNYATHDIGIISSFRQLRVLKLWHADLNGRYPFLFNFPLLQKLSTFRCDNLKWDLGMLAGLPLLKELECYNMDDNECVTGSISSLRVLKNSLEKVHLRKCNNVEGNFMDLADFPNLKELDFEPFEPTNVTGDIRDIGQNDFPSLESLILPTSVYGGHGYEFQRISDGPELIRAVHLLKKQHPTLRMKYWYGFLSRNSPDWYDSAAPGLGGRPPPFYIKFVKAGSRFGYRWAAYRWESSYSNPCEVNWLDPEPDRDSSDYEKYTEELQGVEREVHRFYKGWYQPPTEEEYNRRREEYNRLEE